MSLTLVGAPFIAAQSSQSHHPLIEILSMEMTPSIPFVGSFLDAASDNMESYPAMFTHSSGRLSLVFADSTDTFDHTGGWAVNYAYTDTSRSAWAAYDRHTITAESHFEGLGACELSDATIGVVYFQHTGATRVLKYMILPETGGAALNAATIATEGDVYVSGPCVIKLADDSYFMAYVLYDVGTAHYHLYTRTSADFATWSAASEIDFGSVSTTVLDTDKKGNPALLQDSTGAIWLYFDNVDEIGPNLEELTNIYYSMTEDAGVSWGASSQTTLAATNASQAQSADAVVLVGNALGLTIGDTTQAQAIDKVNVTIGITSIPITLADSTQTQTIGAVVITGGKIVEVVNSTQVSTIDAVVLSYVTTLTVQGSTQAQSTGDTVPSNVTQWSNYTTYGEVGKHPFALQKSAGHQTMIFDQVNGSFHMDHDSVGWTGTTSTYSYVNSLSYDTATGKLYTTGLNQFGGISAVNEIDVPSWTVTDGWNAVSTTPAFDADSTFRGYWHSEGKYTITGDSNIVSLLDATTDTITEYRFALINGKAQNVTWTPYASITAGNIRSGWLDLATNRLYVYLWNGSLYSQGLQIGYIDITEVGPTYTFTTIVTDGQVNSDGILSQVITSGENQLMVYPSVDIILINYKSVSPSTAWPGALRVYNLSTGGLWKMYTQWDYSSIPWSGFHAVHYMDGKIYGGIAYVGTTYELHKRGLCIIDTTTDSITYSRPSWASVDEYGLRDFCETDTGKLLIASYGYGITLYDPIGSNWTLYDNDSIPGLTPSGGEDFTHVAFDSVTQMVFAGLDDASSSGVIMFSLLGAIHRSMYSEGALNGGVWVWAPSLPLVYNYNDYETTASLDPIDSGLYAVWIQASGTDLSLKWAREEPTFDVTTQIVRGTDITLRESIDGSPSELLFTVASGHLFDRSNTKSLWKNILKKGKKLTYRIGDQIAGIDYWASQGTFYVSEAKMKGYERGVYPLMDIVARDEREIWAQTDIRATPYYSAQYPEDIIGDLLEHYADKSQVTDIILPVFDNRTQLYAQWIDKSLKDCIDEVARRYGYFVFPDIDGIIRAKKITDTGSTDLTYTDNTKLLQWTPDDSFSDYTNQVVVHGEEQTYIETLLTEKRIAALNASHRWNTGDKTYTVWYSDDRSLVARNPRLVVLESVTALAFDLAGGCDEELNDISSADSTVDNIDKYCEIEVSSPDLTSAFIAALLGIVASYFVPDWVVSAGHFVQTGKTIPVGSYIRMFFVIIALNILASTGNFQYEIWGQPVSKARRSVQSDPALSTANDFQSQQDLGRVLTKHITDPLCYSTADCNVVATYEMMWVHNQRDSRVSLSKIIDLRLQVSDKIQGIHPYSNDNITIVVTDRTRKVRIPEKVGGNGDYTDDIEGWVVT